MSSAYDKLKEQYLTEVEVANLLGIATERVRDLRSNQNTGKQSFIPVSNVSAKCHLYHIDDILQYIRSKRSGLVKSLSSSEKDE